MDEAKFITLEFNADKIRINGPKVDGGFTVSFDVGQYEQEKIAKLLEIPQQINLKVKVEIDGE